MQISSATDIKESSESGRKPGSGSEKTGYYRAAGPSMMEKKQRKKNAAEKVMNGIFFVCGMIAIAFVLFITAFLVSSGVPAIGKIGITKFLFGSVWASTAAEPKFGILPFILTSVYGTLGAIIIAVPIGLLCAIFLAKVASSRIASLIRSAVELLAGIPSVVYGLVGMIVIVPMIREMFDLSDGANLLSAILLLSIS